MEKCARGSEGSGASFKNILLECFHAQADGWFRFEALAQSFLNDLVHPAAGLVATREGEPSIRLCHRSVLQDRAPELGDAAACLGGAGEGAGHKSGGGCGKIMERVLRFSAGSFSGDEIGAVGFIDGDEVSQLHDAALDALQFVSGAGKHDEEEEIDHVVDGGLGLADADGFNEDVLVAGRLAEEHGLASALGNAAQRAARWRGSDEGHGAGGESGHAGLVTEDAAAGELAAGIDGQNGDALAVLGNEPRA